MIPGPFADGELSHTGNSMEIRIAYKRRTKFRSARRRVAWVAFQIWRVKYQLFYLFRVQKGDNDATLLQHFSTRSRRYLFRVGVSFSSTILFSVFIRCKYCIFFHVFNFSVNVFLALI